MRSSSAPRCWNTSWLHRARTTSQREIMPARYSGRPKATIDALAMTVLSRSKKAASIASSIRATLEPPPRSDGPNRPLEVVGRGTVRSAHPSPRSCARRGRCPCSQLAGRPRAAPARRWWRPRSRSCWPAPTGGALLVDLAGDVPAVARPGRTDRSGADRLAGGRGRRARRRAGRASRWAWSTGSTCCPAGAVELGPPARVEVLAGILAADARSVVVDCGCARPARVGFGEGAARAGRGRARQPPGHPGVLPVAASAGRRPAAALRRWCWSPRPGGPSGGADVEDVVGVPVVAEVPIEPAVARAVDAGLLATPAAAGARAGARAGDVSGPVAVEPTASARSTSTGSSTGSTGACSTTEPAIGRRGPRRRRPAGRLGRRAGAGRGAAARSGRRGRGGGPRCWPGWSVSVRSSRFLDDPRVTDVMVNGGGQVWIDRGGRAGAHRRSTLDERTVLHLIERVLAPLGRHVDRSSPIVDARLPDGSRVHAVVRPLAVDGPCLTIRRFGARADPARRGAPRRAASRCCSGPCGPGPTWSSAAAPVRARRRCSTRWPRPSRRASGSSPSRTRPSCACPATTSCASSRDPPRPRASGEVRIRDLVRAALRMRPDRIVVGEVRAGEALDMLQAMNTGHEGSLSTCHANGPLDALRRLETMVLMGDVELPHAVVREQVVVGGRPRRARRPTVDGAAPRRGRRRGRPGSARRRPGWPTRRLATAAGRRGAADRARRVRPTPIRRTTTGSSGERRPAARRRAAACWAPCRRDRAPGMGRRRPGRALGRSARLAEPVGPPPWATAAATMPSTPALLEAVARSLRGGASLAQALGEGAASVPPCPAAGATCGPRCRCTSGARRWSW